MDDIDEEGFVLSVGIDLGYGFVKATNGAQTVKFPALVEVGRSQGGTFRATDYEVAIDGVTYFVGELARREGKSLINLSNALAKEEELRVLWLTALALLGDEPANVVTGLPLSQYETRERFSEQLAKMRGTVTIGNETRVVDTERVQVVPQAMGAMMAGLLEPETMALRNPRWMEQGGYLLLVDVGTRTTGVVTFETQPEFTWVSKLSGATDIGMIDVFRTMQEAFGQLAGSAPRLEEAPFWETLLDKGETWYGGKTVDFRRQRDAIVDRFGKRIAQYAVQLLGGEAWNRVAVVFLAGGGATLPQEAFQAHSVSVFKVPEPQMANAMGFYLFGRSRG